MPKVMEFTHISQSTRDRMVVNFVEAIDNLQSLECPDLGEIMDACDLIGASIRGILHADDNRGLLLFARLIIERANRSSH